jgi:signal peptidase I
MSSSNDSIKPSFKKSTAREYLESVVVAVILALFIRTFVVQAFKIPTGSMETNLLIGDHLLVNKIVYSPSLDALESKVLAKKEVRRGDVVVFKFPEDPTRDFIKRVIGLPGESVEIRDKTVYIDGKALDEPTPTSSTRRPSGETPRASSAARARAEDGGPRRCRPTTSSSWATTATTAGTAASGASCRATR